MKRFITFMLCGLLMGCAAKKPVTYVLPAGAVEVKPECVGNLRCEGIWLLTDGDGHLYCKGKLKANLLCRGAK